MWDSLRMICCEFGSSNVSYWLWIHVIQTYNLHCRFRAKRNYTAIESSIVRYTSGLDPTVARKHPTLALPSSMLYPFLRSCMCVHCTSLYWVWVSTCTLSSGVTKRSYWHTNRPSSFSWELSEGSHLFISPGFFATPVCIFLHSLLLLCVFFPLFSKPIGTYCLVKYIEFAMILVFLRWECKQNKFLTVNINREMERQSVKVNWKSEIKIYIFILCF